MKMSEILDTIRSLACSQGMYGRLYRDIMELKENSPYDYEELVYTLESKNFTDSLDFVMWYENGGEY